MFSVAVHNRWRRCKLHGLTRAIGSGEQRGEEVGGGDVPLPRHSVRLKITKLICDVPRESASQLHTIRVASHIARASMISVVPLGFKTERKINVQEPARRVSHGHGMVRWLLTARMVQSSAPIIFLEARKATRSTTKMPDTMTITILTM